MIPSHSRGIGETPETLETVETLAILGKVSILTTSDIGETPETVDTLEKVSDLTSNVSDTPATLVTLRQAYAYKPRNIERHEASERISVLLSLY